ncbi:MAG TPA: ATP-binding protein [Drouetiella sp.]
MSIWHKLLLLVLIPLAFEVGFVLILGNLLQYEQRESEKYEQSKEVALLFNKTQNKVMRMMTKIVVGGSQDASRFYGIDEAIEDVRRSNKAAQDIAQTRSELRDVIAPCSDIMETAIQVAQELRKIFNTTKSSAEQLAVMRRTAVPMMLDFERASKNLLSAEQKMKSTAPKELEQIQNLVTLALVLGTIFSIVISVGAAWIFVNDILKRLRVVEENARLLAMRAPLKQAPMGVDEIATLDSALHNAGTVLEDSRRKELAILDVATDVICSLDKRMRITAVSAASMHAWGYSPDDLLGNSVLTLQQKESEATFRAQLEEIYKTGEASEFEAILLSSAGQPKDFLWKVNWSDENQSFYCVSHDISERRAADRMKQRFIAIVSHDLGTPLSSISATLSVLLATAQAVPEAAQNILRKAEESLERLTDLIRDLLDLEKLEAGKVVLDFNVVSLLDTCNAACDSIEFLAKSMNVKIVRPNRDAVVSGDERRLIRVLINLISNAIKFSPRGGTVMVSVRDLGANIEVSVKDEGPGIPEADREKIFEKFQQSSTASTTKVKGTGLGLAIAKLIVEGHKGTIGVDSEVGKGSRFFFTIPNFDMGGEE